MYTWITDVIKRPLVLLVLILILLFSIYGIVLAGKSLLTTLGFGTKENLTEKLIKTENELDKLIEITKKNEEDKIINDAINKIEIDKIVNDTNETLDILKEESRILDEVLSIERTEEVKVVEKIVEKETIKVETIEPNISRSQEVLINNIILRANQMEGSK